MYQPHCTVAGVVYSSKAITPEGDGKPYQSTIIRLKTKQFPSGKSFANRVEVRDYSRDAIQPVQGAAVSASGPARADAWIYEGKAIGRLVISARLEPLAGDRPAAAPEKAASRPSSPPAAQTAPAEPVQREPDDDVPF